jgi:DNA-binding MarR family transcriptional regulator
VADRLRTTSSRIVEEIKQTRPFPNRTQEGVVSLLRTADILRRRIAPVVERYGVTLQQYNVLRILRGAAGEGLPTLEIASRMIEQAPGITRLLDRLEGKGLVRRERCASDRRQVLVWISESGGELLATMDAPVDEVDRSVLGGIDERELAALLRLLDKVRGGSA